jgi:hypothetical protein
MKEEKNEKIKKEIKERRPKKTATGPCIKPRIKKIK